MIKNIKFKNFTEFFLIFILFAGFLPKAFAVVTISSQPSENFPTCSYLDSAYTLSLDEINNILYMAGAFGWGCGPSTGHGVVFNTSTNQVLNSNQKLNHLVHSSIPDGNGGFYVGGRFTATGTVPIGGLIHILPNGQIDTNFNANFSGYAPFTFALSPDKSILYIGGWFYSVGGQTRYNLAAVNATNGQVTSFNSDANGIVRTLALSPDGQTLYVGGEFTQIGGQPRNRIAAIDTKINN